MTPFDIVLLVGVVVVCFIGGYCLGKYPRIKTARPTCEHNWKAISTSDTFMPFKGGAWTTISWKCSVCGKFSTSDRRGYWPLDSL